LGLSLFEIMMAYQVPTLFLIVSLTMGVLKDCVVCGELFQTKKSHIEWRKTCSMKCRAVLNTKNQSGKNHPMFKNGLAIKQKHICKNCNNEFISDKGYASRVPKYCSSKCFGKFIGSGLPRSEQLQIRQSKEYYHWRKQVFKRDNYTCVFCNEKGGRLNADHIKSFAIYPDLRLDINNGRTLCVECHKKTDTFGGKTQKPQIKL
jgi:5-methylcytosine-specific restriction endonuclease McrA